MINISVLFVVLFELWDNKKLLTQMNHVTKMPEPGDALALFLF